MPLHSPALFEIAFHRRSKSPRLHRPILHYHFPFFFGQQCNSSLCSVTARFPSLFLQQLLFASRTTFPEKSRHRQIHLCAPRTVSHNLACTAGALGGLSVRTLQCLFIFSAYWLRSSVVSVLNSLISVSTLRCASILAQFIHGDCVAGRACLAASRSCISRALHYSADFWCARSLFQIQRKKTPRTSMTLRSQIPDL